MAVTVNDPIHSIEAGTCRKVVRTGFAAAHNDIIFASKTVRLDVQQFNVDELSSYLLIQEFRH